jgi:O-antigen ligase
MAARAESVAAPVPMHPFPYITQEPLRLGLGLVALLFYMWLIYSSKLIAGDIAVALLGVGVLLRGGSIRLPAPLLFFMALIAWGTLGLFSTSSTVVTTNTLIELAKLLIIMFCVLNVVRTAAELRMVLIAWLAIFALYPLRGALYNQYICQCTEFGRVAWNFAFNNPNDLASLALVPLGVAAGVATVERTKWLRLCAIAGVASLALIIMLTQSRGAILALGVSVILLPIISKNRGRDVLLLAVLFGLAAILAPKDVWDRVAGLSNVSVSSGMEGVDKEGSAEARWAIWGVAARTARDNPLIGIGAGMMPVEHRFEAARLGLNSSARGIRDTHSTYLRIAAESGFPGLAFYLLLVGSVFMKLQVARKSIRQSRPREHQLLFYMQLSLISWSVASLFGTYGSLAFTYFTYAMLWLAADILSREPWYVSKASAPAMAAVPQPALRRSR